MSKNFKYLQIMFLLLPLVSVDGLCNLRRYTFFNFPHIYLYMCDELSSKTVECLFFSFFLFGNKVRANRHFIRHLRFYFYLSEICAICRTLFPLIPNSPKSLFSFIFSFFFLNSTMSSFSLILENFI